MSDYFDQLRRRVLGRQQHQQGDPSCVDPGVDVSAMSFATSGSPVLPSGSDRNDWASIISSKRFWMPDNVSSDCYRCNQKFTFLRRRHHCRICGQIFCNACSTFTINGRQLGDSSE